MDPLIQRAKLRVKEFLGATSLRSGVFERAVAKRPYTILMYHRVVDPESVPYPLEPGMFVRPQTFAMQMEFLAKHFTVLPLMEIITATLEGRSLPPKALALTFDDGWFDNVKNAIPVLAQLRFPATIFLPTAYIGKMSLFDFDRYAIGRAAQGLEDVELLASEISRLKALSRDERKNEIELAGEYSAAFEPVIPRQFLTWNEVRALSDVGFTFGSHSHTHPMMDELANIECANELNESRATFQREKVPMIPAFCFPNGRYSEGTLENLQVRGFSVGMLASRTPAAAVSFPLFSRIGVHDAAGRTEALFARLLS